MADSLNGCPRELLTFVKKIEASHGWLDVQFSNFRQGKVQMALFNLIGEKVLEETLNISSNRYKQRIKLTYIDDGVYFLRIENTTKGFGERIVVISD